MKFTGILDEMNIKEEIAKTEKLIKNLKIEQAQFYAHSDITSRMPYEVCYRIERDREERLFQAKSYLVNLLTLLALRENEV